MTYTAEQVESAAEIMEQDQNAPSWKRLSAMLRDYAALLREHESAKAVVTDEAITLLRSFQTNFGARRPDDEDDAETWDRIDSCCAALEAVAPMLASSWVPDGWQLVPVEATDEMCEAAWESDASDYVGEHRRIHRADLAYKAMLAASPKPETEE